MKLLVMALGVAALGFFARHPAAAADACTKNSLGQCCSAGSEHKVTHAEKNGVGGLASASGRPSSEVDDYSVVLRNSCSVALRIALSHKCNVDNTAYQQIVDVPPGGRTLGLFGLKPDCHFAFDEVGLAARAPDPAAGAKRR